MLLLLSDDLIITIVLNLGGKDVRRVCKRLKTIFDGCNRRMVLKKGLAPFPEEKLTALAPSITDLTVDLTYPFSRLAMILHPRLTSLCMRFCTRLPQLTQFRSLERLDLQWTSVEAAPLAACLRNLAESLLHLNIGGTSKLIYGMDTVGAAIGQLTKLESLRLESIHMRSAGIAALTPHLPATLRLLDLGCNDIEGDGAEALAQSLAGLACLRELDISYIYMTSSLADCLGKLTGLRELVLSNSSSPVLSCHSSVSSVIKQLATSLKAMSVLRHLDLKNNLLGVENAMLLVPSMPSSLTSLDLSYNLFDDEQAAEMRSMLPSSTNLLHIFE
jgi:Leucine-rich repeat (LRR) protein